MFITRAGSTIPSTKNSFLPFLKFIFSPKIVLLKLPAELRQIMAVYCLKTLADF